MVSFWTDYREMQINWSDALNCLHQKKIIERVDPTSHLLNMDGMPLTGLRRNTCELARTLTVKTKTQTHTKGIQQVIPFPTLKGWPIGQILRFRALPLLRFLVPTWIISFWTDCRKMHVNWSDSLNCLNQKKIYQKGGSNKSYLLDVDDMPLTGLRRNTCELTRTLTVKAKTQTHKRGLIQQVITFPTPKGWPIGQILRFRALPLLRFYVQNL